MVSTNIIATSFSMIQAFFLTQEGWGRGGGSVGVVEAVRSKEGCYDDYAMTCEEHKIPLEEIDFDLEEACYRIEDEVFLGSYVTYYKLNLHPEYLNGIEATDEFCPQMQEAYSHCSFCAGVHFHKQCRAYANYTRCGDKPTKQELLTDPTAASELIQSEDDIDRTCQELQLLSNQPQENMTYPRSINLCKRQKLVSHLCPGKCKGGCFDEEINPPTCDIPQDNTIYNNGTTTGIMDWESTCDKIRKMAFDDLDNEAVFEAATRLDYLRAIPSDHYQCPDFREAYPHCFWCQNSNALCFDSSRPPTCRQPDLQLLSNGMNNKKDRGKGKGKNKGEQDAVREGCQLIFQELRYLPFPEDIYNVSKHSKFLFMLQNTSECDNATQTYHKCLWCDHKVSTLPCLTKDPCHIDVEIPPKWTERILKKFGKDGPNNRDSEDRKGLPHHRDRGDSSDSEGTEPDVCGRELWEYSEEKFRGPYTADSCFEAVAATRLCPDLFCPQIAEANEFSKNYLGTTTEAQRNALIWASRISSILSFLGASFILYDILSNPKLRVTVYHQLLIGMAIFDIVTALAWCFATAAINKDDTAANHVEGVMGTHATCKTQAFFVQLGFTSVFYNVSLAVYYVLVISDGWKEFQLRKIRLYMHLLPVIVGLGLSFAGIPFYSWIEYGCHLEPVSEDGGQLWSVLVFVILPLGLSIMAITLSMLVVYNSVRKRAAASRKWNFGIGQASKLEQDVFWQCLFYVLAFYITWPIMFAVYLASIDVAGPLALTMTVAFVAPLQGFSNFCVYIRPKLKARQKHQDGSNRTSFFSRAVSALPKLAGSLRQSGHSVTVSGTDFASGGFEVVDPSVALALMDNGDGSCERRKKRGTFMQLFHKANKDAPDRNESANRISEEEGAPSSLDESDRQASTDKQVEHALCSEAETNADTEVLPQSAGTDA